MSVFEQPILDAIIVFPIICLIYIYRLCFISIVDMTV